MDSTTRAVRLSNMRAALSSLFTVADAARDAFDALEDALSSADGSVDGTVYQAAMGAVRDAARAMDAAESLARVRLGAMLVELHTFAEREARRSAARSPGDTDAVLTFETTAGPWVLTREVMRRMEDRYPSVRVSEEAERARAWVAADPARRKTPDGMPLFLAVWMSRANKPTVRSVEPGEDIGKRPSIMGAVGGADEAGRVAVSGADTVLYLTEPLPVRVMSDPHPSTSSVNPIATVPGAGGPAS